MAGKVVSSLEKQILALPSDVRDRVLERASILFDSGLDWEEADRLAFELETKKASPGVVRADDRPADSTTKPIPGTG
jgi:hypothetical protein